MAEQQAVKLNRQRRVHWSWFVLTFMALAMAGYAAAYFAVGEAIFPDQVAASFLARPWGIYSHAFFGLFGIAVGPFQFLNALIRQRRWHRRVGKVYLAAALGTGLSGFYMAVYAYGGWVTHLGFGGMALAILITTLLAYREIRAGRVRQHRAWMIRSYAVMFSAVTFRVWLGVLSTAIAGDFSVAYGAASWLSWVLNLVWAEVYLRRSLQRPVTMQLLSELSSSLGRSISMPEKNKGS